MLASYLDHTNLKPQASRKDIEFLCTQAAELNMASVCINPSRVKLARDILAGSNTAVGTVIGFPLGALPANIKWTQARQALQDGASELDMVINIGLVKDADYAAIENEIQTLLSLKSESPFLLKVIVETALLEIDELKRMVQLISNCGVDFIKTSTGFSTRGVTMDDIRIINSVKSPQLKVKASGGIKTLAFALELINAGVDRIGSSQGAELVQEYRSQPQKVVKIVK